ncbi:MAG: hypothetical protein AAGF78_13895 [Pseudomonadota bacterium]
MTQTLSFNTDPLEIDAGAGAAAPIPPRTAAVRIVRFDRMGRPKADHTMTAEEILQAPPLVTWRRDGRVAAMAIAARPEMANEGAIL